MKPPSFTRIFLTSVLAVATLLLASEARAAIAGRFDQVQSQGGGWFTGIATHGTGRLYGRTDVGGLYKSTDSGDSWTFLSGNMTTPAGLCVQGVAVRPNDANLVLQCVGTSYFASDPNRGIWRSTNGGAAWSQVLGGVNFSGNDQERWGGECIAFNPQNYDEIWAGTRGDGIWRSQDAGLNWQRMGIPPTGQLVTAISLPPAGRSDFWIGSSNAGLTVSGNNGINWTTLSGTSGGVAAPTGVWRIVLEPDGKVLVSGWNASGPVLFEFSATNWSNPGTYTWTSISWPAKDPVQPVPLVAALSDGRIIAGSLWGGGSYGGPRTQIRSAAGVWSNIDTLSGSMPGWQRNPSPGVVEGGRNALVVDPSNSTRWFMAGGYAPFRSQDSGATWQYSTVGISETVNYRVCFDPANDQTVYLPMADHGGAMAVTNLGTPRAFSYITTRSLPYPDDLGLCRTMWSSGSSVLALGTDERDDWKPRIYRSVDFGDSWSVMATNLPAQANRPIVSAVVSPDNPDDFLVVLGGTDTGFFGGVYRTTNGGSTFGRCSGLPVGADYGDQWTPMADVVTDANNQFRYVWVRNYGLYKSSNRGTNWNFVATGVPAFSFLAADKVRPLTLWAGNCCGQADGLYRTVGGGAWTGGFGFTEVTDVNAVDGRVAVIGKRAGDTTSKVYYSGDNGASWNEITRIDHRLGNAQAVAVDPWRPGEVWISTNGNSVWRFVPLTAAASFDDNAATILSGQGGGNGWAGNWTYDAANFQNGINFLPSQAASALLPQCIPGGLAYGAPSSQRMVSVPDAGLGTVSLSRSLTQPVSDATLYFSFFIQPNASPGDAAGMRLRTASGPMMFIGKPGGSAVGQYVMEDVGGGLQAASPTGQFPATNGRTVRLVVKGAAGVNDAFKLYVDPMPGAPEPASPSLAKISATYSTVTGVGLFSNGQWLLDDVRVGATWESVTSQAPGPLVINETAQFPLFDANEDGANGGASDAFVEIVNTSTAPVDMSGMTLQYSNLHSAPDAHLFPAGTVLEPGCAIVVFGGGGVSEGHTPAFGTAWVQRASNPSVFGLSTQGTWWLRSSSATGRSVVAAASTGSDGGHAYSRTRSPDLAGGTMDFFNHSSAPTPASPGRRRDSSAFCTLTRPLGVFISRGSIVEGENHGYDAAQVTVSLPPGDTGPVMVQLRSDKPAEASASPDTALIPAGLSSVTVPLTAMQDFLADGDQVVTLTAIASGFLNGSSTLTVRDSDRRIFINEIDAQQFNGGGGGGGEFSEFIELYDGGIGNKPLHDFMVVLFDGSQPNDGAYQVVDLVGRMTDSNGYFVINSLAFPSLGSSWLTNGLGAVAIYKKPTGGGGGGGGGGGFFAPYYNFPPGTAPVVNGDLIDAVVHGTDDGSDLALVALLTPGGVTADEGPAPNPPATFINYSIGRCPDARAPFDSGAFRQFAPTPGGSNLTYPGYATWAASHGAAAPEADDDHDGLSNLIEYALGGDPAASSQQLIPAPLDNPFGELRLLVHKGGEAGHDPHLRWDVEVSTDLEHWTTRDVVIVQEDCATLTGAYTGATPRVQMRLRVSSQP